ncbi:expressed unknown protein [Ectocarpus siliculosus]|uniref:Uncharacterized protein n=1 Tax=Ectocarpus siliculosus TaxID=2880 RepID=D7G8G3_ECTSI|nr:expressed unknown protein [Ectocarpus siliculosus]|eukprot:CBJ28008.1 expressed unknown protein [Ectocarpus siliculosus]
MNAVGDTKQNHGELRACLLAFLDQFLQEHCHSHLPRSVCSRTRFTLPPP